ncbi:HAMP domain-containing protein [candidate division WOR-3 bacterium]|nr:HAMP domain-containing protein [candidate division WOR-3 bacterium]
MTLRTRLVLTVAGVSLLSAAVFTGSLLYVTRSALNVWENRAVERALAIAAAVPDPATREEARQGYVAYHQLKAITGLIEQRVILGGLLFGAVIFGLSLSIAGTVLLRATRPLKDLADALDQAGRGDLAVQVNARPGSEVGTVIRAFNRMTERLRLVQERLRRSERLAAWRDVARILGHEVRNPLTPIRLSVERIQLKSEEHSPDLERVIADSTGTILEEIATLDRIVREFSEFARLPEPEPRPTDVNRLLGEVVGQYGPTAPAVEVDARLDPGLGERWVDAGLMRRAFGNLTKNALEALSGRPDGRLVVATRAQPNGWLVSFSDNGAGIPTEACGRVFDPYFTTKTKGTGLGLAVVRTIVEAHGGTVGLETGSAGTTFTLSLPERSTDET